MSLGHDLLPAVLTLALDGDEKLTLPFIKVIKEQQYCELYPITVDSCDKTETGYKLRISGPAFILESLDNNVKKHVVKFNKKLREVKENYTASQRDKCYSYYLDGDEKNDYYEEEA